MKKFIIICLFFIFAVNIHALDFVRLFRHSEIAEKNSVFVDIGTAPFVFADFSLNLFPFDIRLEYMLPLALPFSAGFFFKTPNPNLNSFGTRIAYHFDLNNPNTDLYFVYSYDFGYLRNDILEEYDDFPVPVNYYDFRVGVRRFFGSIFGLSVESGFKFESIIFMFSINIR